MSDPEEPDPNLTYRSRPSSKTDDPELTSRPLTFGSVTHRAGTLPSMGVQRTGLELGRELGRGGQAAILAATQRSLRREVAVKQLLSDEDDSEALIREAYVTGALEHPNIVPVHDLVFDARGLPQLVLKRIEGRSWLDFIREPALLAELDEGDALEWHLRVAIQLTRALSFAHERGIIHRDIKPSNVMIGTFGEVYLLDWGLAASFREDEALLPRIPEREVAGTQAYMAPEQAVGVGEDMGAKTDVYLLAASLWHAAHGRPPWRSTADGRETAPTEADLPRELEIILMRALKPDSRVRTASAETFRRELEGFLRQRGSHQLVDRAEGRAEAAVRARAAGEFETAAQAATEAAVLFRAALEEWPENPAAVGGEAALLRARVESALKRGLPAVAEQLLASITEAPADLVERVEEAARRAHAETSRLSALGRESDKGVEVDFRRNALVVGGLWWIGLWVAATVSANGVRVALYGGGATAVFALSAAYATRARWTKTHYNRATIGSWLVVAVASPVLCAVAVLQGATYEHLATWLIVLFVSASSFGAVNIDPRAGAFAGVWVVILIASMVWPATSPWLVVGGNVVMFGIGFWVNLLNRRARVPDSSAD